MPNYEYYVSLAKDRDRFYRESYQAAYRDLMLVYQSETEVQKLLFEQLSKDKETNEAMLKFIQNPPKDISLQELKEVTQLYTKLVSENRQAQQATQRNRLDAAKLVKDKYDVPETVDVSVQRLIQSKQNLAGENFSDSRFLGDLQIEFAKLETDEQKEKLLSKYASAVENINPGYTGEYLSNYLGVNLRPMSAINIEEQNELSAEQKKYGVGIGAGGQDTLQKFKKLVDDKYSDHLAIQEGTDGEISLVYKQLETRLDKTPTVEEISKLPQFQAIAPPTEQEVLTKAAQYYRPYATQDFEEFMVSRESQADQKEQVKEEAKRMTDNLPDYAKKLVPLTGEIESIIDVDYEELTKGNNKEPEKLAFMMLNKADYNLQDAMNYIETEFDNPLLRQRAYAILGKDLYEKNQSELETLKLNKEEQ